MRLVYGQNQAVANWVASRIPQMHGQPFAPEAKAIGVCDERGEPLGGVVFTNWQPWYRSIEAHFASASPRWLTRRIVVEILDYAWSQLQCRRITAITPSSAASALRFLESFGFVREGLVRHGFGEDDAVISGLLSEEWLSSRWVGGLTHGQAARSDTPGSDSHGKRSGRRKRRHRKAEREPQPL